MHATLRKQAGISKDPSPLIEMALLQITFVMEKVFVASLLFR
jgi:hypothetical protein